MVSLCVMKDAEVAMVKEVADDLDIIWWDEEEDTSEDEDED